MSLTSPNRGYPLEEIDGDAGTIGDWARALRDLEDGLSALQDAADKGRSVSGKGKAVDSLRRDAGVLSAACSLDRVLASRIARALEDYSDAFALTAKRANEMIEEIEAANSEWNRLDLISVSVGQAAMAAAYGDDAEAIERTTEAANSAIAERNRSREALDDLWTQYERFYEGWDAAYDAARSALARSGGVSSAFQRDAIDALIAANGPDEVSALWASLDAELRTSLRTAYPGIIGNLEGIPYDVRAAVNAARLAEIIERDNEDGKLSDDIRRQLDALQVQVLYEDGMLISFDPDGASQVTAALAYGDISTASDVSVIVPGMMSTTEQVPAWGKSAELLNDAVADAGGKGATVVWFGYDSPNFAQEPSMRHAEYGGDALATFLRGVGHFSPSADLAVIAHSYGSTTAAVAIGSDSGGLGVDQFITIGSAGLPNDDEILENLQSDSAPQIFATQSDDDIWAPIGKISSHSTSPLSLDGAIEFGSDGGVDDNGEVLLPTPGHDTHSGGNFPGENKPGGYLDQGSESFYNVQKIITAGEPGTELNGEGSVDQFWDYIARAFSEGGGAYY